MQFQVFVKVLKDKAYYKRYQTKYRRRREGKTDYYSRKRLITQAKNKYGTPKYRAVVRITNKDIIGQIISAKINGDSVLACAYSHELKDYGISCGLTNWSAAYATGLLLARRVLKIVKLESKYEGNTELDWKEYDANFGGDDSRPFTAYLDIGLRPATTGSRVFGFLRGLRDGGVCVPLSESRMIGYDQSTSEVDSELLRSYIYGGHVMEYMNYLQEEDEESYKRQFSKYIEKGIGPDDIEKLYEDAHAKIREEPFIKKEIPKRSVSQKYASKKYYKQKRNNKQRKNYVKQKLESFKVKIAKMVEVL